MWAPFRDVMMARLTRDAHARMLDRLDLRTRRPCHDCQTEHVGTRARPISLAHLMLSTGMTSLHPAGREVRHGHWRAGLPRPPGSSRVGRLQGALRVLSFGSQVSSCRAAPVATAACLMDQHSDLVIWHQPSPGRPLLGPRTHQL